MLLFLLPPLAIAAAVAFAAVVVYSCRYHSSFLPSGLLPLILSLWHHLCCHPSLPLFRVSHLYHCPSLTRLLWLNLQLFPLYTAVTAAAIATDAAIVATAAVAAVAQGIDSATNKLQKSLQRLLVISSFF